VAFSSESSDENATDGAMTTAINATKVEIFKKNI